MRQRLHGSRSPDRLVWVLFLGLLTLPLLAGAQQEGAPLTPAPGTVIRQAPAEICALLDNPKARGAMDGLLFNLLWSCGRQSELGRQPGGKQAAGPALAGEAGLPEAVFSVPDVQVNGPNGPGFSRTQSETSVAQNPLNGTLCVGFNDSWEYYHGAGGITGFARSTDRGQTWQDGGTVNPSAFGDPSMVWRRADGYFYLATLDAGGGLALHVSTDDCQSFNQVSIPTTGGDDKEILVVDNSLSSPHYGNFYLIWTDFGVANWPIRVIRSTDGGATWSAPITLDTATGGSFPVVQGGWLTVAPNGEVYAAWLYYTDFYAGPISIRGARSTDGGVTWAAITAPLVNAVSPLDSVATGNCGRPSLNGDVRYLASPQIAADKYGYVHVVYSYDPDGAGAGDDVNVYYRRSTNGGTSWGTEIKINDDATTADQYQPTLSVADGQVQVSWYDRRDDPANNYLFASYKRISQDNGVSWLPSERIGDAQSPVVLDPGLAFCYHGDYDQSTWTVNNAEFPVWSDDRGGDPDVFVDPATRFYRCEVDIAGGTHTCNGPITLTTNSGIYRVARVDLADGYQRLDAFVDFCSPTGWSVHFADSPTCDGAGGDAGTTTHNAESHLLDRDLFFYGHDVPALATVDPTSVRRNMPTGRCHTWQWTISEDVTNVATSVGPLIPLPGSSVSLTTRGGFESAPYTEPDSEDPGGLDANLWYVGLNRTVGSAARAGTGVNRACFVLSRQKKVDNAYIARLCGIESDLIPIDTEVP